MKRDKKRTSPLARQRKALYSAAQALQQTHFPLVSFLTATGRDPDVERQLEGMAWINGQLQGQLEDQLPVLTHHLLTLLWPYFLRPTPSMTVLEWLPDSLPGPGEANAQVAGGPRSSVSLCR